MTTSSDKTVVVPTACPACSSTEITTASKTVDTSSYWRCGACGEVWNVERRRGDRPYSRRW